MWILISERRVVWSVFWMVNVIRSETFQFPNHQHSAFSTQNVDSLVLIARFHTCSSEGIRKMNKNKIN